MKPVFKLSIVLFLFSFQTSKAKLKSDEINELFTRVYNVLHEDWIIK